MAIIVKYIVRLQCAHARSLIAMFFKHWMDARGKRTNSSNVSIEDPTSHARTR